MPQYVVEEKTTGIADLRYKKIRYLFINLQIFIHYPVSSRYEKDKNIIRQWCDKQSMIMIVQKVLIFMHA